MIRLTELPASTLDELLLDVHLQCVYMHLAEQKDLWECTAHTHEFFEFGYIYKGSGLYHIDGITYQAETGDLFIIPAGVTHYEVHDEKSPFELLFFMVKHLGERTETLDPMIASLKGKVRIGQDRRLKSLMDDIYEEIVERKEGYLSMLDGMLKQLYLLAYRAVHSTGTERRGTSSNVYKDRNKTAVAEIQNYIKEHIETKCTVESLARQFFYHPKYLTQLFKRECGLTLSEFIADIRIEYAKELLLSTEIPVEQIAQRLHFSSPQHFYRRFKQVANHTPVQYRNSRQNAPKDPFP